jgi:hypothetical protein
LTPTCNFNETLQYAFILEAPDQKISLVHYSDRAEKVLGQELSPLLHGAKVLNQETTDSSYRPSKIVKEMIDNAKSLNEQGIEWHHHVLFPGCRFNTHSPQFTLVFEDPHTTTVLENVSDTEPTNDLKQIEALFYKV